VCLKKRAMKKKAQLASRPLRFLPLKFSTNLKNFTIEEMTQEKQSLLTTEIKT